MCQACCRGTAQETDPGGDLSSSGWETPEEWQELTYSAFPFLSFLKKKKKKQNRGLLKDILKIIYLLFVHACVLVCVE